MALTKEKIAELRKKVKADLAAERKADRGPEPTIAFEQQDPLALTAAELGRGASEMAGADLINPRDPLGLSLPGLARFGLGAMQFMGAPIEGLSQAAGNLAARVEQKTPEGQFVPGLREFIPGDPIPALPTIALNATRFASPFSIVRRGNQALQSTINRFPKRRFTMDELFPFTQRLSKEKVVDEEVGDILKKAPIQDTTPLPPEAFQDFLQESSEAVSPQARLSRARAGQQITGQGGTRAGSVIREAGRQARKGPQAKYREAERIARSAGDEVFPQENLDSAIGRLSTEAAEVRGVLPTRPEQVAGRLEKTQADSALDDLQGLQDQGVRLPQDVIDEFGLGQGNQRSIPGMIRLRRRLRQLKRAEERSTVPGSDELARQYRILEEAVDADLRSPQVQSAAPDVMRLIDEADAEFKTNVAPFFTEKATARQISNLPPEAVVDQLFKKNNFTDIRNVKGAISKLDLPKEERVELFRRLSRTWYDDMIDAAENVQTGRFDSKAFLREWNSYTPEVKKEILGLRNFRQVQAKVRAMQKAERDSAVRPPMLGDLLAKKISSGEASNLASLLSDKDNIRRAQHLRSRVPREEWNKVASNWLDNIITKSIDPDEGFVNRKFLLEWQSFDPKVKQAILGNRTAAQIDLLTENMRRADRAVLKNIGSNSPFIVRIGAIQFLNQMLRGEPVRAAQTGFVFGTPTLVGKLFTNPRGLALLNRSFEVPENSVRAQQIMAELNSIVRTIEAAQQEEE